jgi:hypothetical protein
MATSTVELELTSRRRRPPPRRARRSPHPRPWRRRRPRRRSPHRCNRNDLEQTITLSGTVASSREAQTLSDAATAGFALQGAVVNQLTVKPQTAPPAVDRAVDGLAAFITAASPGLLGGSGHLINQGLALQGQAFSAAATAFQRRRRLGSLAVRARGHRRSRRSIVARRAAASLTALVVVPASTSPPARPSSTSRRRRPELGDATIKRVPTAQVQIVGYRRRRHLESTQ